MFIIGLLREVGWPMGFILVGVFMLALCVAIIPHEVAHGFVALKMGDPSAKLARRLNFNPANHFDPFGFLSFLLIGFGWAKPVPVNPFNYKNFRRGNFWVSIAGIITNLIIAFIASFFLFLITHFVHKSNMAIDAAYWFFYLCTFLSLSLAVFNLLPIYPLDGFNMLISFTKPNNRYMQFMRQNSMYVFIGLILFLTLPIFPDIIGMARNSIVDLYMWFWRTVFFWA